MNATSNQAQAYFDLHTSGIGFIQRVREVSVKGGRRGEPFLACTVVALSGQKQAPFQRYFDLRVSGAEAKKLVRGYLGVEDPKKRPLVQFRIGDLWSDPYIRPSGELKGEVAATLKGRLLKAVLFDPAELASIEQYELVTRGIGYLNRVREVSPKQRDPFLSCSIAALAGPVEAPEYRYFDTIVTNDGAQQLARSHAQDVDADRKVLIAFRLHDMRADPYIRTKGERAGEPAANLESTLVHIGLVKVDGRKVYPIDEADVETPKTDDAKPGISDAQVSAPVQLEQEPQAQEREAAPVESV